MKYKLIAAAGLLMASASANAAVSASFQSGAANLAIPAGSTLVADFDSTNGGGTFSGANTGVMSGNYYVGGTLTAAPPKGDDTKYLAVLNQGSAAFSFDASSNISFYIGSADDFNKVVVTLTGAGGTSTFTGSQLVAPNSANGGQNSDSTNGRVTIAGNMGELFTGITFSSTGNSFEIDNLARTTAAVPEASTWAMFLMGFGALGVATRRRQRTAISFG